MENTDIRVYIEGYQLHINLLVLFYNRMVANCWYLNTAQNYEIFINVQELKSLP